MAKELREASKVLGSTPKTTSPIAKIALSPVAPLVAETGESILRITNYQTAEVVGQVSIPFKIETLSFSPDGKFLLAMPVSKQNPVLSELDWYMTLKKFEFSPDSKSLLYVEEERIFTGYSGNQPNYKTEYSEKVIYIGERSWNNLIIFSEPWSSPILIHHDRSLVLAFHSDWLDEKTVIVAGTVGCNTLCIALFDVETGNQRIVYREEPQPEPINIHNACCSPSGLVAFTNDDGRTISLYQLNYERNAVLYKSSFSLPPKKEAGVREIAIGEDGQTILILYYDDKSRFSGRLLVYNCQGQELDQINASYSWLTSPIYQYGTVCLRTNAWEIKIHQISNSKFRHWCSHNWRNEHDWHEGVYDLSLRDEKVLLGILKKELGRSQYYTEVVELVDLDILQLASENPKERCEAALALGNRRFRWAVPDLVRHVWDNDLSVQKAAIEALADIGDPTALPHLIRAVG